MTDVKCMLCGSQMPVEKLRTSDGLHRKDSARALLEAIGESTCALDNVPEDDWVHIRDGVVIKSYPRYPGVMISGGKLEYVEAL